MASVGTYLRLMRPGDWVKNAFVLPGPLVWLGSHPGEFGAKVVPIAGALIAFCLVSSGFYAINDAIDAPGDRLHPVKRRRPVASGAIAPSAATLLGLALLATALAIAAAINVGTLVALLVYSIIQVIYNVRAKRVMLVDVVAIAAGFAVRAASGALAIEVAISPWLILCVFFLCLYLGFIKRLCDLASAGAEPGSTWRSPAGYDDRGELSWLLGVSAVLALMTYIAYALSEHAAILMGIRAIAFALLSPLVLIAMHRFYRRASRGLSDSPLAALREDRLVLASVALYVALLLSALYVPAVGRALEALFLLPLSHATSPGASGAPA